MRTVRMRWWFYDSGNRLAIAALSTLLLLTNYPLTIFERIRSPTLGSDFIVLYIHIAFTFGYNTVATQSLYTSSYHQTLNEFDHWVSGDGRVSTVKELQVSFIHLSPHSTTRKPILTVIPYRKQWYPGVFSPIAFRVLRKLSSGNNAKTCSPCVSLTSTFHYHFLHTMAPRKPGVKRDRFRQLTTLERMLLQGVGRWKGKPSSWYRKQVGTHHYRDIVIEKRCSPPEKWKDQMGIPGISVPCFAVFDKVTSLRRRLRSPNYLPQWPRTDLCPSRHSSFQRGSTTSRTTPPLALFSRRNFWIIRSCRVQRGPKKNKLRREVLETRLSNGEKSKILSKVTRD